MTQAHRQGRPLRFLLTVLLCWTGMRVAAHYDWSLPEEVEAIAAEEAIAFRGKPQPAPPPLLSDVRYAMRSVRLAPVRHAAATPASHDARLPVQAMAAAMAEAEPSPARTEAAPLAAPPFAAPPVGTAPPAAKRWSASAWLLWRAQGSGNGLAGGGQLGGSQAGVRIDRDLTVGASMRLAPYGRLTAALQRPYAPEAAIGIAIQPRRSIPITIAAERRVALGEGGRDALAFFASGGIGPIDLPLDTRLEGYGQAGMVGLRRRDGFADGRIALLRALADTPLAVGASLSGGAQPGAARMDIGPALELRLPIGGRNARLIGEWRQRVAGQARPGSGPAVILAADF